MPCLEFKPAISPINQAQKKVTAVFILDVNPELSRRAVIPCLIQADFM
jgi:hypothetical protein